MSWDREQAEARLQEQLILWHGHGALSGHTHRRGDDWHVHHLDHRPGGIDVWQTVWEDGEVTEDEWPPE